MMRRMMVIGTVALGLGLTAWAAESSHPPAKPRGPSASRSGYLPINGLKLYYECTESSACPSQNQLRCC
jgi:hypothetical protein